jgi:hypothetical protein
MSPSKKKAIREQTQYRINSPWVVQRILYALWREDDASNCVQTMEGGIACMQWIEAFINVSAFAGFIGVASWPK